MLKLNPEIEIIKHDKYYYLHNTKTSSLYRIMEPEYRVIQSLNKNLSTEGIKEELKQKNLLISSDEICNFKTSILKLDILVEDSGKKTLVKIQPSTNIFHLRFPLLSSSKFLKWIIGLKITKYLFTFPFLLLILSIIGIGIFLFSQNWRVLLSIKPLFQAPQYIYITLTVFLVSALLHELAHGFVCTYYGGKAEEIGIGIFYFIPTFYISLKGIWLFKKKSHKIFTYLAGVMIDLSLCSLFITSYQLFPQINIILLLSKILILSLLVRSIFIVNPFIGSDFYRIFTILSDTPYNRLKVFKILFKETQKFFNFSQKCTNKKIK